MTWQGSYGNQVCHGIIPIMSELEPLWFKMVQVPTIKSCLEFWAPELKSVQYLKCSDAAYVYQNYHTNSSITFQLILVTNDTNNYSKRITSLARVTVLLTRANAMFGTKLLPKLHTNYNKKNLTIRSKKTINIINHTWNLILYFNWWIEWIQLHHAIKLLHLTKFQNTFKSKVVLCE